MGKDDDGNDKASTGYDVLQNYINENPTSVMLPFLNKLLEFREFDKLLSTYGETLLAKADSGGYVHGRFNQLGAETGRLSSSAPNLQNLVKDGIGGKIRECFLPDVGDELVTCDMDSAEVRLAADFSNDPLLLDSLLKGVDMHSKLASVSFSIIFGESFTVSQSTEPVTVAGLTVIPKELRTLHKNATFCKFYKGGPGRIYAILSKYINLLHKRGAMKIAKQISYALDQELAGLNSYLDTVIGGANMKQKMNGYKFNRVRYFPKGAFGEAANYPIQNSNSEAIKIAMINIDKWLTFNGYGRIVLSIHDELVCSVRREKAEECAEKITELMNDALGYFLERVPPKSAYKIGNHW
jgi:DNA polymerase I-like protein with 3'-5' exonuclease and polymerase domains